MAEHSNDLTWPATAGPNMEMWQTHDKDLLKAEFARGGLRV